MRALITMTSLFVWNALAAASPAEEYWALLKERGLVPVHVAKLRVEGTDAHRLVVTVGPGVLRAGRDARLDFFTVVFRGWDKYRCAGTKDTCHIRFESPAGRVLGKTSMWQKIELVE